MRKQLKDLTENNIEEICAEMTIKYGSCSRCPYYCCAAFCKLTSPYKESHPEEWIEWEEERADEDEGEVVHIKLKKGERLEYQIYSAKNPPSPKGFIEFKNKDGNLFMIRADKIVGFRSETLILEDGELSYVKETYEEIKAKIAEALK